MNISTHYAFVAKEIILIYIICKSPTSPKLEKEPQNPYPLFGGFFLFSQLENLGGKNSTITSLF